jgi:integrase
MAAFTQRKNGRWTATVRRPGFRNGSVASQSETFSTLDQARKWSRKIETAIDQGRVDELMPSGTLRDAIERFKKRHTVSKYQTTILDWFDRRLGERPLNKLGRADFAKARDDLRESGGIDGKPIKPATVNRRMALMRTVLNEAVEAGIGGNIDNPIRGVSALTENNRRDRVLTADERLRLFEAAKAHPEAAMFPLVVTAFVTAARAGELIGLKWSDVDLQTGKAHLRNTKNGDSRNIGIRGQALELLRERAKVKFLAHDFVFYANDGKAPFVYDPPFREIRRTAQLEDFRFHDIRHCSATALAQSGNSVRELADFLGHRTLAMVMRYSHLCEDRRADLADVSAKALGLE